MTTERPSFERMHELNRAFPPSKAFDVLYSHAQRDGDLDKGFVMLMHQMLANAICDDLDKICPNHMLDHLHGTCDASPI